MVDVVLMLFLSPSIGTEGMEEVFDFPTKLSISHSCLFPGQPPPKSSLSSLQRGVVLHRVVPTSPDCIQTNVTMATSLHLPWILSFLLRLKESWMQ
jgi:hypothetical protein